jgi:adenine phosphoribosyltransferase
MTRLVESVYDAPVVEREDGYRYLVHPVSNGLPTLEPQLIREVVNGLVQTTNLAAVDKIASPVTMGIHVAAALSLVTDIPLVVVRNREYGLPGEVAFEANGRTLYLNDVGAGDRVLVLDDLLSTGRSLAAVADAVDGVGAELVDLAVVVRRVDTECVLPDEYDVTSLVDVRVGEDEVSVVDHFDQ